MEEKLYLGIDPGVTGAWAILSEQSSVKYAGLWSETPTLLALLRDGVKIHCAVLEQCHAMPGQGVVSMFTFGENIGIWKGMLTSLEIPRIEVTPRRWQRQVLDFIPTSEGKQPEEDKKEGAKRLARNRQLLKNSIVDFVRRRFPESIPFLVLQKAQGIADAICLAEYGRKQSL